MMELATPSLYVLIVVSGLNVTVRRSDDGDVLLTVGRWYLGNRGDASVVAIVHVARSACTNLTLSN